MKKILTIIFALMFAFSGTAFSEDAVMTETEPDIYKFPQIKPEFYGIMGYRFIGLSGSEKAGEFEYLHNSFAAGGEIRLFPFPHRFHLEADILNKRDYFLDMSYAYKDLILFREINRSLFHNLDHIVLYDLNTATSNPGVTMRNTDERYGLKVGMSNLSLRLKTPDFPLHFFIDGRFVNKKGDMQQRFMGGSGYFNNQVRVAQKKNVDSKMKEITVGINSHLGPIEAELSHTEKRFDFEGDKISSDSYTASTSTPVRPAGVYPHNLVPDLKGSSNTLKLHTSYTGHLVASATLSRADRENKDSGAKADLLFGSVDVVYTMNRFLTFLARYKHRELDLDNPTTIPAGYLGFSSYTTAITGIRHSLSTQTDTLSGIVKYRPLSGVGLNAEYTYERTERENADEWKIAPNSTRKNITLSAHAKLMKKLTLKAKYSHQNTDNPAHNITPNKSDSGSIGATWTPWNWLSAMLSYNLAKEKKYGIHYITSSGTVSAVNAQNRTAKRDRLTGSITLMPFKQLSITPGFAYIHNKIVQDLSFNNTAGVPQLDKDVPYKDTARSYFVSVSYLPTKNFNMNADANHTKGKGAFYPGIANALQPVSVASFSELNIRETGYSVGSDYKLKGDWTLGIKYRYNSFRDTIDNIYDDARNGIVRIVLLTVSKKW